MPDIPHKYDELIERYRGSLPMPYVRALIWHESRMNPKARHPGSNARGLMQITSVARREYNTRTGSNVTSAQLFDPETNIKVGTWYLRWMLDAWRDTALDPARWGPDPWQNFELVRLITAGWNSGPFGLARHANKIDAAGDEVTHAATMERWRERGGENLAAPSKEAWQRRVADTYRELVNIERESTDPAPEPEPEPEPEPPLVADASPDRPPLADDDGGIGLAIGLAIGSGIVAALLWGRR